LAAIAAAFPAFCGATEPAAGPLPEISVTATRERRNVDETTSTVTVVPAEEIDERFVKDIRDLIRNEPGVVVKRAPSRFGAALGSTGRDGNAGFNIRGLEGNRVLMQVDGIRVPQAFSFGASNFGRGGYTDVSTVRAIEILRGPASSLYGSDGLAGVVSFLTFDPADLLGDERLHASAAVAWAEEDRSTTISLRGAARVAGDASAGSELMAIVTRRDGEALDNFGTNESANATRTAPNPQDNRNTALLAKWVQRLSPDAQLRLTLESIDQRQDTDVLSARSAPPLAATSVLRLDAQDDTERRRASFDGVVERLGWSVADRAQAAIYWQDAETVQKSFEDRNTAADRTRDNRYGEQVVGLNTQFDLGAQTGAAAHRIVYGLDLAQAEITNLRDGTVPPAGETFPTKAFADSDYDTVGAFVQDEIAVATGWFITPALRYDRFDLKPKSDSLFQGTPTSLADDAVSPKLSLRWRQSEALSLYANYAQGFLAPAPAQVNNGFTNLTAPGFAYVSLGNPDLKPESSNTIELGARGSVAGWRWAVAVFDGRYEDFIEQITVGGTGAPTDPLRFQYVNLGEVRIRGVEARVGWRINRQWRTELAYAQADGDDETRDLPLNSVQPPKLSFEAEWTPLAGLTMAAFVNHVWAKDRQDIDSSSFTGGQQQFATPSFTTLDLTANWRLNRHVEVGAGVFNLTDRKYWNWSDVQGVAQTSTVLDAYTQPPRNFAVRARLTY
jgi:hemoglobin/transferrin/lactoferrin receptor protein